MVKIGPFLQDRKNIKLLECEKIIHDFKEPDMEIPNIKFLLRNSMNTLRNFTKSVFAHIFAQFRYLAIKKYMFGFSRSRALKYIYTYLQNKRMWRCGVPKYLNFAKIKAIMYFAKFENAFVKPRNLNFSRNKLYIWNLQITRFKMIYNMFLF